MDLTWHWTRVAVVAALTGSLGRAQTIERVSVATGGAEGDSHSIVSAISADGRFVAFESLASSLVAGDTNGASDIFVRDRLGGSTERVSLDSGGAQASGVWGSFSPALSGDGRFIAFTSDASNLVAGDTNGTYDVFVRDRQNGTTERVSVDSGGAQGNSSSGEASISADGRFVAFYSMATNLVAGDTNQSTDIFVRDRQLATTERVSVDSNGTEGNGYSNFPSISADGRFVAFQSQASNLVAGDSPNGFEDIFVHDRQSATTERVSIDSNGAEADSNSEWCAISADGRCVAFHSDATNLVVGDTNGLLDVFLHDRQGGMTERVSVDPIGAQGNMASVRPAISADGRFVAFDSEASNLVAADSNGFGDTFVRDRQLGTTERVSVDAAGTEGNSLSENPSISADGRFVAFDSDASNLVAGDTNTSYDVLVRDRGALPPPPPPYPFCFGDASAGACPCGNYGLAGRGCENSASTGGAVLSAAGNSSLGSDTLALTSAGELPSAFSLFLQGDLTILPLNFGDGLRCTGGTLKRLYLHSASGGIVSVPQPGEPSISARSAALGDPISAGTTRYYQTYYRDPVPTFCATPQGNGWNVSAALSITWAQ